MRRRLTVIVPLLGLTAFAGYYAYWDSHHGRDIAVNGRAISRWVGVHGDGARDAEAALRRGAHVLLTYGYPADFAGDYHAVLFEDYGVVTRTIAGCVVDDDLVRYARAYNAVMRRDLEQRFGSGLFKTVEKKATARYAARTASKR